jgi:hypothetical protein
MFSDTPSQVIDRRLYPIIRTQRDYLRLLNLHRLKVHPDRKSHMRRKDVICRQEDGHAAC